MAVTVQQEKVLRILADAPDQGLMAWQVRDRLYPPDSKMRTYRPGQGEWQTAKGALGNLAAGRVLANLDRLGLAWRPFASRGNYAYRLTDKGRRVLAGLR